MKSITRVCRACGDTYQSDNVTKHICPECEHEDAERVRKVRDARANGPDQEEE